MTDVDHKAEVGDFLFGLIFTGGYCRHCFWAFEDGHEADCEAIKIEKVMAALDNCSMHCACTGNAS